MGFLRKTKTFTGIQHQPLFELNKRPRALADSTGQWIHDRPKVPLAKYNNDAVETSIVQIMKFVERFAKKKYTEIQQKGKIQTISQQMSPELRSYIQNQVGKNISPLYFYSGLEPRHLARVIMKEELGWNPGTNQVTWQGEPWWVDDVFFYLKEQPNTPNLGWAFTAEETPFRVFDSTRPFGSYNIEPSRTNDVFVVRLCFRKAKIKEVTYKVNKHVNPDGTIREQESWWSEESEREENQHRNAPNQDRHPDIKKKIREYQNGSDTLRVYEEGTDVYYCYGDITLNFSRYQQPSNINQAPNYHSWFCVAWTYTSNGKRVADYTVYNEAMGVPGLYGVSIDFGDFIPRVYYRRDKKWIKDSPNEALKKQTKLYANRLGYPLWKMQKVLKKSIKQEDEEKIAQTYLTFGIDIKGKTKEEKDYLWFFINAWAKLANPSFDENSNQTIPKAELDFSNKLDKTLLEAEDITYTVSSGSIGEEGTIISGVEDKQTGYQVNKVWSISKQVGNQVLKFEVKGLTYTTHVMGGHMVSVDLESEDAKILFPILFGYLYSISSFNTKEAVLYASMHLEILSLVQKKQSFLGSLLGKIVTFVATVIINWISSGTLAGLTGALWAAVQGFIVSVVISLAIRVVAKILPFSILVTLAAILAVVGLLWGLYNLLNVSKAFTILHMNAKTLLDASTGFLQQGMMKQQQKLQEEAREYREKMKSLQEERTRPRVNIYERPTDNRRFISIGESTDELVSRTISVNVGLVAIDYISQSVDYSLQLPTIPETLSKRMRYQYGT